MKLQMLDSKKTVITSIDSEIRYYGDFNSENQEGERHFYAIEINDQVLYFFGARRREDCIKSFNKLLSKGAVQVYQESRVSEEEAGWAAGTAADMANPKQHGRVMYSVLSADRDGGVFVWDYNLQKTVRIQDLTPAPAVYNWKMNREIWKMSVRALIANNWSARVALRTVKATAPGLFRSIAQISETL